MRGRPIDRRSDGRTTFFLYTYFVHSVAGHDGPCASKRIGTVPPPVKAAAAAEAACDESGAG